ncbi:MAG: DHH family phosphoesterase [Flavobacteriaceae bacterium]|nr:MAG: DHH family phosphoesterase [Flavobacteriaceae bacterium]
MTTNEIKEIKQLLSSPKNLVIVPHRNPDGDAVGSSLGLLHFLQKMDHKVTVVAPNDFPDFLKWMPQTNKVLKYDVQNRQSKRAIDEADFIFLLDFNALHRTGSDMQSYLEKYKGDFIMIDHHQQPDAIARFTYSDTSICSTCQMVYHFIEKLEMVDLVDAAIASCLYAGIMTDTGSFRFASTTSTTHRIIADLIDKGAENAKIHNQVYDTNSIGRLHLLGVAMNNLVVIPEYNAAYITMTRKELDAHDFQKGDTEGVVNYALSVKGIVLAAIFIEDPDQGIIKISLRSKGSFSVNKFARNHFDGGGHDNASGGRTELSIEETVEKFVSLLPQYKDDLSVSYEN